MKFSEEYARVRQGTNLKSSINGYVKKYKTVKNCCICLEETQFRFFPWESPICSDECLNSLVCGKSHKIDIYTRRNRYYQSFTYPLIKYLLK